MTRRVTTILRFVLVVLIIVLSLELISCSCINEQQETSMSESELEVEQQSQLVLEGEEQSESTDEINQIKKTEGMILKLYHEPIDDGTGTYYFFKIEDDENWYRFLVENDDANPIILDLWMKVSVESVEYVDSVNNSFWIVQNIQVFEKEEDDIQNPNVEGIIAEVYKRPGVDCNYYLFKIEGNDKFFKLFTDNPSVLDNGMQVYIEYIEPAVQGYNRVSKIQIISFNH